MIGRRREQEYLEHWLTSSRPEFVVVYGRRRVGKTYLVENYFRGRFAFRATGLAKGNMHMQLRLFHEKLLDYGDASTTAPSDWFEAFSRLKGLLASPNATRDPGTGRLVVFIDEMPWFDTPRSNFKEALEYFWNDWGSTRDDLMLIACGSSTSWLTKNLLANTEGFYGRVTGRIGLRPFSLGECDALLKSNGVEMTRQQVIELYLAFGGIPYYLNLVRKGLSPAQTIDQLCFGKGCPLEGEFGLLFRSLFKNPDDYLAVIRALGSRREGLTRSELSELKGIPTSTALTRVLENLELCGFIGKMADYAGHKNGLKYRIVDPFTSFHLKYLETNAISSWVTYAGTPSYLAWRGLAFETTCMVHIQQIKAALGIASVETRAFPWTSSQTHPAAQIDLVLDRKDGIIDICEMKFTDAPYEPTKADSEGMLNRRETFRCETGTKKALHLVLVSASGVARNAYANDVQAVITADDLFSG